MTTRLFTVFTVAAITMAHAFAQEPSPKPEQPAPAVAAPRPVRPAAPAPAAAQPARPPVPPAQLVNIKIVVNVVEEGGGEPMVQKATSLMLADRQSGSVRAMGSRTERGTDGREVSTPYRTFVDALPVVQRDGRVQVQLTLEYGRPGASSVRVEPLLESGKTLVVSESADPSSDRRTRVELTATILK